MTEPITFGKFLRRTRLIHEMTLQQVADLAGMSVTYLAKIERDELPPPAPDKVERLAVIFNFEPGEFFQRAGRMPPAIERAIQAAPAEYSRLFRTLQTVKGKELEKIV